MVHPPWCAHETDDILRGERDVQVFHVGHPRSTSLSLGQEAGGWENQRELEANLAGASGEHPFIRLARGNVLADLTTEEAEGFAAILVSLVAQARQAVQSDAGEGGARKNS
jgi:hypothetical protein